MRTKKFVVEKLLITDYAAEGRSLGRLNGKVIFVEGAIPGDIADVLVTKKQKGLGRRQGYQYCGICE